MERGEDATGRGEGEGGVGGDDAAEGGGWRGSSAKKVRPCVLERDHRMRKSCLFLLLFMARDSLRECVMSKPVAYWLAHEP